MKQKFCRHIAYSAQRSVLYEVSATPKPGLVDRNNSGAHKDMDFYTFMASSAVLYDGFYKCALEGASFQGANPEELLKRIRSIGIEMEMDMFRATNGVNTHKGIIFSLGIISAAAGKIYRGNNNEIIKAEDICDFAAEMTKGITIKELTSLENKEKLTNGEKLYIKYGLTGIRGEVESGFRTVREKGISLLRELNHNMNIDLNDKLIQVLLSIMTTCEDSNVVSRHNIEALEYVRNYARRVIASGGILAEDGHNKIKEMDREFIERNISPGGSADLLAVTVMLATMEGQL